MEDPRRSVRRATLVASTLLLAGLCLACLSEVDGERAETGECPDGEECSDATPDGLVFVGTPLFDDSDQLRLGPVLVGGTFQLGLRTRDGQPLPPFEHAVGDASVLGAALGEGVFGPVRDDGTPLYPVDAHLTLTGRAEGTSLVRVVEPGSGALYDRLELEVFELDDVAIRLARDPGREALAAGCEEMLAARLVVRDGATELRAFDQGLVMRADGQPMGDEPLFWDCFTHEVPADDDEVVIEADVAGRTFSHTFPVRSLEELGLSECPPVGD